MFSYAVTSMRLVLVVVLGASAAGKLWNREALNELSHTLRSGLRLPLAGLVSTAWVVLEAVTAAGLLLPLTLGYAAALAVLVFGCLTGGAAMLVAQRRRYFCNCFGVGRSELSRRTVARNGVLTAAAVFVAVGARSSVAGSVPAPVLLAAVLSVLLGAVLYGAARPVRLLLATPQPGPEPSQVPRGAALSGRQR